jgi:cytoskeletal protein RodZ
MLEGDINQINLIERLVELWREQFTGAIRFENDGIIKIIYFKGGDILSASTNDRSDSIDEILMRAGKVSREHVKQALAKRKESETLGDALLNLGFITRKELTWSRRVQVVGVIRSIAAWTDGSFTIVADYLPKRDEGTLFPLPQVLVELIVTEQDRAQFERALDGGEAVFSKTGDFDEVWRRLGLNEDAEAIAVEIDGSKNATDIATASGRDTFNVYKLLHALATLGVLARAPKAQAGSQFSLDDDFASVGVADAADSWNNPDPDLTDADFAEPAPAFDLDDDVTPLSAVTSEAVTTVQQPMPTLEMETPAVPPAPSAWDEADEIPLDLSLDTTTPSPKMPVWEGQIGDERMGTGAPAPEPQWGFDEAQLETARAATAAAPAAGRVSAAPVQKRKSGGRYGLLVALMVIAIVAAAGYFAFMWWQGRQDPDMTLVARQPVPRPTTTAAPVSPPATETGTITETTASTQTTTSTQTGAVPAAGLTPPPPVPTATTTIPPATASAPPPVTASAEPPATQALPRVTARTTPAAATPAATTSANTASRARVDAMASEFASNASGNFTVQIQILCDAANVEKLMRDGGQNVWFVPQSLGTRSCYRVFWGRYNTREQAQQALAQIPAGVRDRNAAVKAVPKG